MKVALNICLAAFFLFSAVDSGAQILNPKKLLERKATERVNRAMDKKADQVLDSALQKKAPTPASESKANEESEIVNNDAPPDMEVIPTAPALQTYSKFDFVPGEKVVFFEDFSSDNIGDFPALWNTNGSAEIVTTNLYPGKWMKYVGRNAVWTDALLNLPENYTIEFDLIPIAGEENRMAGYGFRLLQSINPKAYDHGSVPGKAGFEFSCEYFGRPSYRTYINGDEGDGLGLTGYKEDKQFFQAENKKYHFSIWVQKSRVRLYQDQNKLFDLPKAFPVSNVKMDRLRFEEGALMVSNIRIAVGAPDLRNKLITEGKLVSYGIYFDVNKAIVKPESYGTLKEIAAALKENPDVKIKIIGYTDSDGADDANLDLSKRRGAAVKDELVKLFDIDAARIESGGKGETNPVALNDSPSNKALNRRVEFIKQ